MKAQEKALEDILKLVYAFLARPESEPFREPVDWETLGLVDYPAIIKRPMDLGQIKKRLQNGEYRSVEEAAGDIRLVWTNCMTYNQDGSEFYQLADTFARRFEDKYAEIRVQHGLDTDADDRVPSLEDKIQLSYDIFKIDTVQLGKVLTMVEKLCPDAAVKSDKNDEVLINIDCMTPICFHEVARFVQACAPLDLGKSKKRLSSGAPGQKSKKAR